MIFETRLASLEASLKSSSPEERYRKIMALGEALPPLAPAFKILQWQVQGCQSVTYLLTEIKDGRLYFKADSEALISKGLVAIVIQLYQGMTPQEILTAPRDWPTRLGLASSLSPTRYNGLASMLRRIILDATAYSLIK